MTIVWNRRRKFAWLVLVPVAIMAAIALSLPLILNRADYTALLVEQAEFQLGRKVEVGRAHVEVFPYVRITLDEVTIREPGSQEPFVSAERLFLDLRIFPLLAQTVVVKRIEMDRPKVAIRRGAAGILNFSDLFSQGAQPLDFAAPMLGDEIAITDGEFLFEDSFGAETTRTVTLQHVTTTVKRTGTQLGVKFYATIPHEQTEMAFAVTGQISREAIEGAPPGGKAVGQVEAKGVNLSRLAPFLNDHPILRTVSVPMDLTGAFEYRWAKDNRALTLTEMRVSGADTTITGSVALSKLFTPQMALVSSLTTTPFRLKALVNGLSEEMLQSYSLGFLKQGQVTGSIRLVSLQVGWAPEQERRLTLTGTIVLLGGNAVVDAHPTEMRVSGADTTITGSVALSKLFTPQMALVSSLTTTPFRLEALVNGLPEETLQSYSLGFLKQGQVTGSIQLVSLQVGWAPEQERRLTLTGTADLLGGNAVVGAHFVPISEVKGQLLFDQDRITIEQVTGKYGLAEVTAGRGAVTRLTDNPYLSLDITGTVSAQELAVVVARFAPKALLPLGPSGLTALQGEAAAAVKLDGSLKRLDDLRIEWGLEAKDVGFTDQRLSLPFTGLQGRVRSVPRGVRFERLAGRVGRSTLTLDGEIAVRSDEHTHYALTLSGQADAKELLGGALQGLSDKLSADGMAGVELGLSGRTGAVRGLGQARVKVDGPPALVKSLTAGLSFEGDRIQATLDASGLDLDLLTPSGERSALRGAMESFLEKGSLSATLSLHNTRYRGIAFDEIQATVTGKDRAIVLDPVTGRTGKGAIAGHTRVALPPGKPAAVESTLHLKGIEVEPLFRSLGITEPPFTGTLTLDGAIRGDGADPRGTAVTVNGDARVMIAKGYSQKLSATAKIVRLLDLPSLLAGSAEVSEHGMPFDCMSGRVVIRNGIADVQDYRLDSPIMKITAAGTYDMPNDRYDMVMVVTPFGSSETLLQSIPLFGKLFAGEREGFSTAFFEVKGPLADPMVTWVPIKSIGSGLTSLAQLAFDVMKNTIMLPKELIAPSDKARSPCSSP